MSKEHTFHIPVMGIGYTADTPLKVAKYGINSTISLVDDILLEKLRKYHCEANAIEYTEISDNSDDYRSNRVRSYLNLINSLVRKKFEELKTSASNKSQELKKYFNLLPDSSKIKKEFETLSEKYLKFSDLKNWLKDNLHIGSIDVNIMTKVDRENFKDNVKLPAEFNDSYAALRGFATSDLNSSIVLSAGMNQGLYNYIENFEDFFPDENGYFKKKIILKVSDFRSAMIQGRFLAKKGLWVSEFRIESGLNCGGHAFATEGYLMGPILDEFKSKRSELESVLNKTIILALSEKNKVIPENSLTIKVTAQGGVGTNEEHQFLLDYYNLDSIGWGSPFLLVPEVCNIDNHTLSLLANSREQDLYLSNISPLGVLFNNIRGNTKDAEKFENIEKNRPGSSCPKEYVAFNKEFGDRALCTASRLYQKQKIDELESLNLTDLEYTEQFNKITEKSCICVGLGTTALLVNNLDTKVEGNGVSVCPGPNIAYFSKKMDLEEMVDHIYGRTNVIERDDRPNIFVKEFGLYLDFLKTKIEDSKKNINERSAKYLKNFASNMNEGLTYYTDLFSNLKDRFESTKESIISDFEKFKINLANMNQEIENLINLNLSKA
ncbi:MAG: hypothetical protein JXR48_11505 [Candidatus Delongbacteria bacterium]|nr:hypothetical protein [Candidatus Delongbacteria bacterium]MBN2835578.1 hypothetical protein [Candidatus Delongbacteria bacterium]